MVFRDRITIDGDRQRANVKVSTPGSRVMTPADPELEFITVTLPGRSSRDYGNVTRFMWRGSNYTVTTKAVPIVALGRVDHYELTAVRT